MASKREALIASAEKALQKGKPDAALKDYLKALEEAPNDLNVLGKVGDLLVRLNRNEESIPYFTRIAEHYGKDGFYVKAIAMYKKINRLDPSRLEIYEKLAELYTKQGLGMEAKSNYQVLADYLLKQDNVGGAIGIYQKMAAIEPANLQLHVKLADLYTQTKRIPEALKEYAVVASSLNERGAHDEAIRVYEKALKLAPDNLEILKTLVPLLVSINGLEQARQILRKALETTPRSVPLFLLSAEVALAANDMAEARSFGTKAQAVDPDNEEVLSTVVRIQLKGRRPDLAFAAAAPLADIAVRRGEAKKAIALLVPIAKAAPDQEELVRKVIEVAAGAGDETTALPYRSALAEILRKQGKVAEAADVLRVCARIAPDNAEFRARLAQLEPLLGGAATGARPPDIRPEEVTLSGLDVRWPGAAEPQARVTVVPPKPPPLPSPPARSGDEFEFDLTDEDLVEEAPPSLIMPAPQPPPPLPPSPWEGATPPRGVAAAPKAAPVEEAAGVGMDWAPGSAAEALAAYEARAAAPAPPDLDEVVEELEAAHEVGFPAAPSAPPVTPPAWKGPPPITYQGSSLQIPSAASWGIPTSPPAEVPSPIPPSMDWDLSAMPPVPTVGGPLPQAAKPVGTDGQIDEALVEAEVFRKYGLLDKAVDQLAPFVATAPESVKLREKLFELYLEMGRRDLATGEADVLRERYRQEGRAERIRGLDALLGLPQLAAPVQEAAPHPVALEETPVVAELAPAALLDLERFEPGPTTPLDWAPPPLTPQPMLELEPEVGLGLPELVPELLPAPALAEAAAETPPEPSGEVTLLEPTPLRAEPPQAVVAPSPAAPPPSYAEIDLETLLPPAAATPPHTPVRPIESLVAELAHPAPAPKAPEERKPSRPMPSTDDLLRVDVAPAPKKKVAKVTAGDIQLDLLGRPAEPRPVRPKPAPVLPELPADLLGRPTAREEKHKAAAAAPALPGDLLKSLGVTPRPRIPARPTPQEPPAATPEAVLAAAVPVEAPPPPPAATVAVPVFVPVPAGPTPEDLSEVDFCLDQGMVVDAAERLQSLESRFPGHADVATRRQRLEGARGAGGEAPRPALHDILSEDLDSVLDAELGRALSDEMVRGSAEAGPKGTAAGPAGPAVDESGLFSDEQEFFNFADELRTELKKDTAPPSTGEAPSQEVSLEEIFRDFKKGVEQQLSPEDYETHYNLGIAYKEMGLTDEAIGEFQLAAKDPLHAVECCSMLGLCFLEKGLPQLAVKWYRKGLETIGIREDDRLGLLYDLGGVLEQIGDRDAAYKSYLEIYGINAGFRDVNDRMKALKPA